MSYIGIGSPIPDISSLPGQTGGEVEVTLDYPSASACGDASPFSPSEATPPGGVFAATPSGLNINTSTGEVTPVGSTAQAYTISYTVSGVTSQFALTINAVQQSTFSYASNSFDDSGTALPTLAGGTTPGGTFVSSSPSDLTVNASTGELTLAGATVGGPYTITYTTPGPCATSSTFQISITATVRIIANNFALDFNGTDEYVEASNDSSLQLTDKLTLSCWINASDVSATNSIIDKFYDGVDRSYMLRLQSTTIRLSLGNASGSASVTYQSTATLSNNTWYHVVTTFSSADNEVKIYINGSLDSTHSKTDLISSNNQSLRLGTGYNLLNYFGGDMDEVAIWNKAISANAVQEIYNATINNPGYAANLFKLANESQAPVYWNRMGDD